MHFSLQKLLTVTLFLILTINSPSLSSPFFPLNNVTLYGDASFTTNSIYLTQQRNCSSNSPSISAIGRAFYVYPIRFLDSLTNNTASFLCTFSFTILPTTPSCPFGDGFAFLITSDVDSLTNSNGYMGLPKQDSDMGDSFLAVEFDTNDNHIGIGVKEVKFLASADVDLKSGKELTAWIEYKDSEKMMRVWIGYEMQIRPFNPVLATKIDISNQLKEFMRIGFTAKGSAVYSIYRWRFRTFGLLSSQTSWDHQSDEGDCLMCFPEEIGEHFSAPHHSKSLLKLIFVYGGLAAVVTLVVGILAIVSVFVLRRKKRDGSRGENEGQVCRLQGNRVPQRLSLSEIKSATEGFNNERIIGEGGSAVVYEGDIPSKGVVAIKRFVQGTRLGPSHIPFNTEFASMVGCLRHKNLIQLQGWCCERNELVLVYEFMPNGSLNKILHEHSHFAKFLTWERRLNIVLGVASALVYLHEECENQIIHRDVKTCNIMLDAEFNAKLGDFGLAEVFDNSRTRDATVPAGTMGYLAPEYVFSGVPTVKTDVYSFGVVVLEVASGRKPIDECGGLITDWVWDLWEKGRITEAADPKLKGRFQKNEMDRVLVVGLSCVHPNQEKRPRMREVARMLKDEAPLPILPPKKPTVRIQSVLPEGCEEIMNCAGKMEDSPWATPTTHFSRN
ncbi:PREDICTED: L-type lectin-domain containing receptor kinase S.6 [Nicotiana attenuata]|uniref:non-specific serine/threonine protein kinase n=1 Tax=Nicotiana attenuata TaxID=49451 RepID=A0A314L4X5_NICAT|nr:PREDICTED: L-type lectin-domain containing receptor kinase S.6 [Nicotiana attenuata]OIT36638.1 l-type lectin-domain containing receptor kinase s.6 [Nicotiana attenuata]